MFTTTRRTRKPRTCDRACDQPIKPGDLVEYTTYPPGRHELNNTGWLRSVTHPGRCPIPGPTAEAWNAAYPPGTPVLAWPGTRDEQPVRTRTRSVAWELGSGHPVAMVDSHAGGIHLTHLQPLETDRG
ncbi:hypothetical protein KGD82_16595 [Nocardiopsis eucommiae]|uniref:Uncharacterized protein n=1 Tax=Nocardiopsis eucommiae TaxID=2831970 RepID=A0A975QJG7_9ACTN|nr:hypothetical protein KGD82_16595 [Nocardiopsis eucommiae]